MQCGMYAARNDGCMPVTVLHLNRCREVVRTVTKHGQLAQVYMTSSFVIPFPGQSRCTVYDVWLGNILFYCLA